MVKFIDYNIILNNVFNYVKKSFEGITWDRLVEAVDEIIDYGRDSGVVIIGSRNEYLAAEKLYSMIKGLELNAYVKRLEPSSFNRMFLITIDHPMDRSEADSFINRSRLEACKILSITYSYDSPLAKVSDYIIVFPYKAAEAKGDLPSFLNATGMYYDLSILSFIVVLSAMIAQAVGRVERYIGAFIEL